MLKKAKINDFEYKKTDLTLSQNTLQRKCNENKYVAKRINLS